MTDENFLSRWSKRKHAVAKGETDVVPAEARTQAPAETAKAPPPEKPAEPLPPVESLTPESDFTPFMASGVDQDVKRQALKTLFRDPRFNVMDGLDVYIDDYSKPDPLPEGWLEKLNQTARLGDWKPPPEPAPAAAEKPPREQPLEASSAPAPVDTPAEGKPPSEVG